MGMELRLELRQVREMRCSNCGAVMDANDITALYMEHLPLTHGCVRCYEQLMAVLSDGPSTVLIQYTNYDEGKTYMLERRINGHFPT